MTHFQDEARLVVKSSDASILPSSKTACFMQGHWDAGKPCGVTSKIFFNL